VSSGGGWLDSLWNPLAILKKLIQGYLLIASLPLFAL